MRHALFYTAGLAVAFAAIKHRQRRQRHGQEDNMHVNNDESHNDDMIHVYMQHNDDVTNILLHAISTASQPKKLQWWIVCPRLTPHPQIMCMEHENKFMRNYAEHVRCMFHHSDIGVDVNVNVNTNRNADVVNYTVFYFNPTIDMFSSEWDLKINHT